jgi:pimeloyl-ACP methyl ester carboxylesterase
MAALGVAPAHIVGHSFGGAIALQLALDSPGAVRSLCLLEPAILVGASAEGYRASLEATRRRAVESGAETAVHEFLEMRSPGYRERLDRLSPGAFQQAVRDASTTLDLELPSLLEWSFGEKEARSIETPTLAVLGERSRQLSPRFEETYEHLLKWMPNIEGAVIPGATHLMQSDAPEAVAEAIAAFLQAQA